MMPAAKRFFLLSLGFLVFFVALPRASHAASPSFVLSWGTYGDGDGQFVNPLSLDVGSDGRVYVFDNLLNRVQVFSANGNFVSKWDASGFRLTVGAIDNVYVAGGTAISQYTKDGAFIRAWGSPGTGDGKFSRITDITSDAAGNLYVSDADQLRIQKFDPNGGFLSQWPLSDFSPGYWAIYLSVDGSDHLLVYGCQVYVGANGAVLRYSLAGDHLDSWPGFDYTINGIAGASSGDFYVARAASPCVQHFSNAGGLLEEWAPYGSGDGQASGTSDVALNGDNDIYIIDSNNRRIELFRYDTVPTQPETWARVKARYR